MQRFLLFDSGCEACTKVAEGVEQEANGWLRVKSLNDSGMRQLLDQHSPGWAFRPTLVEVDGDRVQVSTGLLLSLRLATGLGVRRAARVARHIAGPVANRKVDGASRRSLLKAAGAGATALVGIAIAPRAAAAASRTDGLLDGDALADAVRATKADAEFRRALVQLGASGFDTARSETVAYAGGEGTTVVLTFFGSAAAAETEAALVAREHRGGVSRVHTEFIKVDREALARSESFDANAFTVRAASRDGVTPLGPGEYFGCMVACIGANCASLALRCRLIPWLPGMLACMVAVCGSKANVCHRVCRHLW